LGHHHVRGPVELVRVAPRGHALEQHAHVAGGPRAHQGAGATLLRPADGRRHAGRGPRDRRLLRLPALLPPRRHGRGPQGMTERDKPRFAVGFDLDGVLIRNPFETCVLPRFAALLKATRGLNGLEEQEAASAVRKRVAGGWQQRMGSGDLVGAYDWDAIYREVATELGGEPDLVGRIDVALWVRECC